jgi:hypothetical protein
MKIITIEPDNEPQREREGTHSATIEWTDRDGSSGVLTVSGCNSPAEAWKEVEECARNMGWTPPKWWQWWRINDTLPPIFLP